MQLLDILCIQEKFSSDRVCVLVLLLLVLMAIYKDYFRIEASTSFLLLYYVVFQH